ncbi:MAG: glycoside hydrolase family 9 protein [Acidobacteriota bacterium]|nr:glycoside hydrolase family 9 protein [Acidobacteriota bacterium]
MQLSLCHLGYLPHSPKTLTLLPEGAETLADRIPFYLRQNCLRLERERPATPGFSARFPSPYNLLAGQLTASAAAAAFYTGVLQRRETRWGTLWQADFSDFTTPGSYQIETDLQITPPFAIRERVYDRLLAGYLTFLHAQRCGCEIFGVHAACHTDDGVLDRDGSAWPVTGGWHDAGDFRKWLAFTQHHLDALATMLEQCAPALERGGVPTSQLTDEIAWGNRFFHGMVSAEGQVFEDVAGGRAPANAALTYEQHWWFENHPGCFGDASDNRWTDNVAGSGDERMVRTTYNPWVQWSFVATQLRVARLLPAASAAACLERAQRAASYAHAHPHDGRSLFLAAELRGRLEQLVAGQAPNQARLCAVAQALLDRQATQGEGLYGYFLEADAADAYRSIAFSAEPALALVRLCELEPLLEDRSLAARARTAIELYVEAYLLADAASNPFALTPYGVYLQPAHADRQHFRNAGGGRGVRTFMHPYNEQGIVHGTSSVLLSHAHLLARTGVLFHQRSWRNAAERLLQWCLGHNTLNRSLFSGIGYRQPTGYSFRIPQLPEAPVTGFIGTPEDTPYLETTTAIEWNTLEYWSIPFLQAVQAACWLHG